MRDSQADRPGAVRRTGSRNLGAHL